MAWRPLLGCVRAGKGPLWDHELQPSACLTLGGHLSGLLGHNEEGVRGTRAVLSTGSPREGAERGNQSNSHWEVKTRGSLKAPGRPGCQASLIKGWKGTFGGK